MPRPKKRKAGRPALPKAQKRVIISCRVKPETKVAIKREARQSKVSTGEVIDGKFPQSAPPV